MSVSIFSSFLVFPVLSSRNSVSKRSQILSLWPQTCRTFLNSPFFLLSRTDKKVTYTWKNFFTGNSDNYSNKILLGVIQQLCGPSFIQFWPPPPLVWTLMHILHNMYLPFITWPPIPPWSFYWPPPHSSCPRSFWMTPLEDDELKFYEHFQITLHN